MKLFTLKLVSTTGLKGLFLFLLLQVSVIGHAQVSVENQADPKLLYERMLESRKTYDFQGVFVYEQGGNIRTFDVGSSVKGGLMNQSLDVLDGVSQQYRMSFNDLCEQDAVSISGRLSPYYNFYVRDQARVAGLSGIEIILAPIDKYRYGYQYVVEPESGMMLRSIILTPERQMIERIQFTQIEFQSSENTDADSLNNAESTDLEIVDSSEPGGQVDYDEVSCARLNIDNGWSAGWLPDGFSVVSSGFDGERATLVYSDGIATMSLFIEDVLDSFLPPSTAHRGATTIHINYLSNSSSTYLVSIVGEVPIATAERVLASLRRK